MREMNERLIKTGRSLMDQIPGAPPVLRAWIRKKYTQLPFKPIAAPELIPKRFMMPNIPKYDRTLDPQEHITTYTTAMKGNNLAKHEIKAVLMKKFGETLTKGALTWNLLIPEHSIDYFESLAHSFIKAQVGERKVESRKADISKISQGESKLLREFVIRF